MKNIDPDRVEEIINGALSRYSGAEPLAGIEQRILQRIGAADSIRRKSRILGWALAFPILIAIVPLAIAVWVPRLTLHPTRVVTVRGRNQVAPVPPPSSQVQVLVKAPPAVKLHRQHGTKIASGLSADERALLMLLTNHPAEARQVLAGLPGRNDEPIDIPEIKIVSLEIDALP